MVVIGIGSIVKGYKVKDLWQRKLLDIGFGRQLED